MRAAWRAARSSWICCAVIPQGQIRVSKSTRWLMCPALLVSLMSTSYTPRLAAVNTVRYISVMDTTDLVRATTIAYRLGVVRSTVSQWELRYSDFPAPAHTIDGVKFWNWPAVKAWHKGRTSA